MKKEKQQKRPKRTKAQRIQALKTFAVDTVYDVVGSILFAIGVYTFAKSADFAPGGVSGLALICNYLWDLPIGTMTLIINIPIIIISYKVVGRKFLLKSFKTMVISTLFLDLVFPLTPLYTGNSFLAAIFSGVFMGAGLALIYMRGSSTGGTDFLVLSLKKLHPHISTGTISIVSDAVIISLGALLVEQSGVYFDVVVARQIGQAQGEEVVVQLRQELAHIVPGFGNLQIEIIQNILAVEHQIEGEGFRQRI